MSSIVLSDQYNDLFAKALPLRLPNYCSKYSRIVPEQAAEKVIYFVIPNEVRNLSLV
jgi:hypothetical protein